MTAFPAKKLQLPPISSDDVAAFGLALANARTTAACTALLLEILEPFEVQTFACGETDLAHRSRSVFYVIEWPDCWRDHYMRSGLVEHDPVVDALAHRKAPFTWGDLRRDRTISSIGAKNLRLVMDLGWTDGLVVPVPRRGTQYGLVSFVTRGSAFDDRAKGILSLLSVNFLERVRCLAPTCGFAIPPAGLTAREIACLALVARGYTDREVAAEVGIAQTTAHEHVENAKRKLATSSRAEATAVAISFAII